LRPFSRHNQRVVVRPGRLTAPPRWPLALAAQRAAALGFTADNGIDEVVQAFIEDDLTMQKRLA
jgi:hypothetical protein